MHHNHHHNHRHNHEESHEENHDHNHEKNHGQTHDCSGHEHNHSHNHHHNHQHNHDGHDHHAGGCKSEIVENLKLAFVLNISFAIIEIVGGLLTNSIAVLSDAVHDLGDATAIGISLLLEKYSAKGSDRLYTYGYRRFSPLGALVTSLILLVGSALIIWEAVPRLLAPQEVHSQGMLGLAFLGVAVNGFAVWRLRKGSSSSANQRAVMLHLLEDAMGWIAVLVGSAIISLTQWYIIDPLLSIGIAIIILRGVYRNLQSIGKIFLQASPPNVNSEKLRSALLPINNVLNIHDVHVWSLDGDYTVLTLHLIIPDGLPSDEIIRVKDAAADVLRSLSVQHFTIAIEFQSEKCRPCEG